MASEASESIADNAEAIRLVNDILERSKYRRALTTKKWDDADLDIIIEECEKIVSLLSKCGKNVNSESTIYTDGNKGNAAAMREALAMLDEIDPEDRTKGGAK